ncbi:MAG: hypothetical protein WBN80_05100 [Prochlorococcaceae cyanobacterium]
MAPQVPLRGGRILLAGIIGSGLGAAVALMLHAVVTHTPVEVSPRTFALFFSIFCAFGAFAGLTLETVRQLQATNPDPAYHPRTLRGGSGRDRP